ncbi:ExbD/TolR family protein [Ahniella affigens]|nr:biopolymer transporter ExbD [Ahniella affigens]
MRFLRPAPRSTAMADINVTPLIDVMLCLLVVFLIAAPALASRIPLDVPGRSPDTQDELVEPLKIRVLASGQITIGQQVMAATDAEPALLVQWREAPKRGLALAVEPDASFDTLAQVLGSARNVGFRKIGFVGANDQATAR